MPGHADGTVAVVIPAYQAAATIGGVVTAAKRALPAATIYVVDDGSRDQTGEGGRGKGATVLVQPRNVGKGAALRTGIDRALADGAAFVVTLDADGQHPAEEIPKLVAPIVAGEADLVLGARARTRAMPLGRRCTNWLSATLTSRIAGRAGPDAQPGVRALARQAAARVRPGEARHDFDGAFQVDGTPTDCVLLAIGMLMPDNPDFVISGINHGQNMGEDVFYSGTVAAAMEGLVAGIPSIAVSYAGSDLDLLATHRDGLGALLQHIVDVKDFPKETLLNINLPAIPGDQVKGIKVTHLGSRVFSEEIALMKDPWGKDIYWIGGGHITWTGDADSDFRATSDGYISVTPLHMDMTNYDLIEVVRKWFPGD